MRTQRISVGVLGAAALLAAAGLARADTVTARYTYTNANSVNITRGSSTMNLPTVMFSWTRQDSPGPGVDASIPAVFPTYCVDIDQSVAGGTNYVFQVQTFVQAGFSSATEQLMDRMWALYQPGLHDATDSAAFQLAIWELAYDSGNNLSSGNFIGNSPSNVKTLAQTYLNTVSAAGYSGPSAQLVVLHSATAQDQITLVPSPTGAAALALVGLVGFRRKR